jgi:lipoprotein-anchoring transpeptidase ErfK/SrfK
VPVPTAGGSTVRIGTVVETSDAPVPEATTQTTRAEPLPVEMAPDGPVLAATTIASTVYKQPHTIAARIGYVRLGGIVRRDPEPVSGGGCKGDWYRVHPVGYMCTDEATTDPTNPLVRAASRRPNLDKPLPYAYGFVRATAPQYLRVPSEQQQLKSEMQLAEHLDWYREHKLEVQRVPLGANDVPLDASGRALLGLTRAGERLSTQLSTTELLGGSSEHGSIPFWLSEGRAIPNVSGFEVPEYAVFADRVRRKTGLSFVDAFVAEDGEFKRRFAVTVDLRLVPATKVKPDTGSPFHGVPLDDDFPLPAAFVIERGVTTWKLLKGEDRAEPAEPLPRRALVPLSGNARIKAGRRFYQLARSHERWVQGSDVSVFDHAPNPPKAAALGKKWIDISLTQQSLVLYEGTKPVYATMVSTGRDRLGNPESSLATPQGEFTIQSKHVAAAMDSEENSTVSGGSRTRHVSLSGDAAATKERLLAAEKAGTRLDETDQRRLENIKKGRHPEYGVTVRRGAADFELRDVPWIQYFAAGYALHGAYWHDVFGVPRSHGCVNLSPIDARYVFFWTEPQVPKEWHGINTGDTFGEGTTVRIRE